MAPHLHAAIEKLKLRLIEVGTYVEENLLLSVDALSSRDTEKAEKVIANDDAIDEIEVDFEEECLKILALHQPVAIDLRFIVAALKINNDLERIGDLAVNIAERTLFLAQHPPVNMIVDFQPMAIKVRWMLKKSLDSLVKQDLEIARRVCDADDEVDDMNREMYSLIQNAMKESPEKIEVLIHVLSTSRHLERTADHATSIAEDVIYMIEGEIVRHRPCT
jgi:phosphate transport system protein